MSGYGKEQVNLVNALMKGQKFQDPNFRKDCIGRLPPEIRNSIEDRTDAKPHLMNLVETCSEFLGGIEALVDAVSFYEGNKAYFASVKECAEKLTEAILADRAISEEATKLAGELGVADSEQKYALVIGIGKYAPAKVTNGTVQKEKEFPDLAFPADDARDLYKYLKDHGYKGPEPLVDDKATLSGIMEALDSLRFECEGTTNPFVLVFFSGHGARDLQNRHYLVPHDGVRNHLFSTALWSKIFDIALDELRTNRLVVFLDACHSAGLDDLGAKGITEFQLDPQTELKGKYFVASCLAGQNSYEWKEKKHGVFSYHLLELLQCEQEDCFESEEVDLWDLYEELKKRVKQTADNLRKGSKQEPYANLNQESKIIITTNQARKKARIVRESKLLDEIDNILIKRKYGDSEELHDTLQRFIFRGVEESGLERFYRYFRQKAQKPVDNKEIGHICDGLVSRYEGNDYTTEVYGNLRGGRISAPIVQQVSITSTSSASTMTAVPNPSPTEGDQRVPNEKIMAERLGTAQSARPLRQQTVESRRFLEEEVTVVLDPLLNGGYVVEYNKLGELLKRPEGITLKEFMDWGEKSLPFAEKDSREKLLWEVRKPFMECWKKNAPRKEGGE